MDISCEELDRDFCADEIISVINTLKTYKAHGSDNVLYEYIRSKKTCFHLSILSYSTTFFRQGLYPKRGLSVVYFPFTKIKVIYMSLKTIGE